MAELGAVSQILGSALNEAVSDVESGRGGGGAGGANAGGGGRVVGGGQATNMQQSGRKISARSIISKGATHVAKKPCRVLVFSAFVTLLAMLVYTVYLLLTHFTRLFTSEVFWEHMKDIVRVSNNAECSSNLVPKAGE